MKQRLDVLLVSQGYFPSRERAQSAIRAGLITVGGICETRPGAKVEDDIIPKVTGELCPYVSRGGLKLQKALEAFSVSPEGKICADAGASTGGFTDCLLQHGARHVYAIDVGTAQLAEILTHDPRVTVMEQTNLRTLQKKDLPESPELFTLDLSFISLRLVLPVVRELLDPAGCCLCLIKPQFEAGREAVGKKGVVHGKDTHTAVLRRFLEDAAEAGFAVRDLTWSPLIGPEGNIEFLGHLLPAEAPKNVLDASSVVHQAYRELKG